MAARPFGVFAQFAVELFHARVSGRAWRNSACPAGVGSTPRLLRTSIGVPTVASISAMRLLTAEGARKARSLALAMVPSSQTAMNSRRDT